MALIYIYSIHMCLRLYVTIFMIFQICLSMNRFGLESAPQRFLVLPGVHWRSRLGSAYWPGDFPLGNLDDSGIIGDMRILGDNPITITRKNEGLSKLSLLKLHSMVLMVLLHPILKHTHISIGNISQIRVRFQTYTNETIKSWNEISPKACLADLKKLGLVGSENAGCLPCLNIKEPFPNNSTDATCVNHCGIPRKTLWDRTVCCGWPI